MSTIGEERVLSVHHWTDRLFSFSTTRDQGLRFSNGHFTLIGLRVDSKPLLRAYSIVSANYEDYLEFLSIKVEGGPLTSRLMHIQPDDRIIIGRKPTGTLVVDYLLPGKRLYMFSTGTGLAPFMSIARDPASEKFEQLILVHGVRKVEDLAYRDLLVQHLPLHEFPGGHRVDAAPLLPYGNARGFPTRRPHTRSDRDWQTVRRSGRTRRSIPHTIAP